MFMVFLGILGGEGGGLKGGFYLCNFNVFGFVILDLEIFLRYKVRYMVI